MHVYSYDHRINGRIEACDVAADADAEQVAADIRCRLEASAKPAIIFTDIVGATPSNITESKARAQDIVVSGVNLPMILTALCHIDEPVEELVEMIRRAGIVSISPETA